MKSLQNTLYLLIVFCISFLGKIPESNAQDLAFGKIKQIYPGEDLQKEMDQLTPGDQLVLHEGQYEGQLIVRASGLRDFPIIIKGYGNGEKRPTLVYHGDKGELMRIAGNNLLFDFLEFRSEKTYGVRIGNQSSQLGGPAAGTENITIQNSIFNQCGGGDISANFYNVRYENIKILNNFFDGSLRTSVYIGSHPGDALVSHFLFKGNVIDGSQNDGPETTIGYGIELKLNVVKSVIEDNYITGTKGPGIMVYGADNTDISNKNTVRNNIVLNTGRLRQDLSGNLRGSGIVVGGGPSLVRDNIVINTNIGIDVINYANRNLLDNIFIIGNTLINNGIVGISLGNIEKVFSDRNVVFGIDQNRAFSDSLSGKNNSFSKSTSEMNSLVTKALNVVPTPDQFRNIRNMFMSGPLSSTSINNLLKAILKNARQVRVAH